MNWLFFSSRADVIPSPCGRRYLLIGLGAVALAGCGGMDKESRRAIDLAVQNTTYYQDRDAAVCFAINADLSEVEAVGCSPQVLAKIAQRESEDQ